MTDNDELVELAKKCGARTPEQLAAFAEAIRERLASGGWRQCAKGQGETQHCAQAEELRAMNAMLVEELNRLGSEEFDDSDAPYYNEDSIPIVNWLMEQFRSRVSEIASTTALDAHVAKVTAELAKEKAVTDLAYDLLSDIVNRTCDALKGKPSEGTLYTTHDLPEVAAELKAKVDALVPPGWKIVPIEPTMDMIVSGTESWLTIKCMEDRAEAIWKAMLEAAPDNQKG